MTAPAKPEEHYRELAAEVRKMVGAVSDESQRKLLLEVAADYDEWARLASAMSKM